MVCRSAAVYRLLPHAMIAKVWPALVTVRNKTILKLTSKRAAAELVSTASKRRPPATYVTAAQVGDPSHLFHSMRLNRSVCHPRGPVVKSESGLAPCCALCRSATRKHFTQVSYCKSPATLLSVCGATRLFHTVDDLEGKKADICDNILSWKAG